MACCRKEYAEEFEIRVCEDFPDPHNLNPYQRLRFGLLASSWLPSPVGMILWSALHVMLLILGGPILWVLILLSAFLLSSVLLFVYFEVCCAGAFAVYGLIAVAIDLVLLLVESISFCWSLVGSLACQEPIVKWKGGAHWAVECWKDFVGAVVDLFCVFVPIGVPWMWGSLYHQTKDQVLKIWARWCAEVVHIHDAIAL